MSHAERITSAPFFKYYYSDSRKIWRMDIFRGTHTAVSLIDCALVSSNNPQVVPMNRKVWFDQKLSNNVSTQYFFGYNPGCSLFHFTSPTSTKSALNTVLQVWVIEYGNNFIYLSLFGRTMALNSADIPSKMHYNMNHSEIVNLSEDPVNIIRRIKKNVPLDHLIFNCHGGMVPLGGGKYGGQFYLGRGFNRDNVKLFKELNGNVRYIWLPACTIGGDKILCAEISKNTGAYLTAPVLPVTLQSRITKNQIDYFHESSTNHWSDRGELMGQADFFMQARRSPGTLTTGLDFNIVSHSLHPRKK